MATSLTISVAGQLARRRMKQSKYKLTPRQKIKQEHFHEDYTVRKEAKGLRTCLYHAHKTTPAQTQKQSRTWFMGKGGRWGLGVGVWGVPEEAGVEF